MNKQKGASFRISLGSHIKKSKAVQEILDNLEKQNTISFKKIRNIGYLLKAIPLVTFISIYPLGALLSYFLSTPVDSIFIYLAIPMAVAMYFSLKRLTESQAHIHKEIEERINQAMLAAEDATYKKKEDASENEPNEERIEKGKEEERH